MITLPLSDPVVIDLGLSQERRRNLHEYAFDKVVAHKHYHRLL
jgi:hypothetical protein